MIALRDRKGRLWCGRLDVSAAVRLRDLAGTDVMALALDNAAATALADDPDRLANALYALLLPSCEARGVSDRMFGRALRGRLWGWWIDPAGLAEELLGEVGTFFAVPELTPGKPKEKGSQKPATAASLWGNVYHLAALAGIDPGPRTFGELVTAADARRKNDWAQTATLLAWIENHAGMGRRGRATTPSERDPTGGLGATGRNEFSIKGKDGVRCLARIFGAAGRG